VASADPLRQVGQLASRLGDQTPSEQDVLARGVELADREADHVAAAQAVLGQIEPPVVVQGVQRIPAPPRRAHPAAGSGTRVRRASAARSVGESPYASSLATAPAH
jgi:hypothetical protein